MTVRVFRTYAAIAADIDLTTDGGAYSAMIVTGTDGDLVLTPHGNPDADQVVSFKAGWPQYLAARAIKLAGSTATKVTVGWA